MSAMLNHGCQKFGEKALNEDTFDDIINISQKNIAALIFGYTSIEALINEIIAISKVSKRLSINKDYFEVLIDLEKRLTIKDKYNLLAGLLRADVWDSSKEPFQSFETIQAIRNEVIHHKGRWGDEGELPIRKMKSLFDKFKIKLSNEKSWQGELFQCREFGMWVFESTDSLKKNIHENLLRKIEK